MSSRRIQVARDSLPPLLLTIAETAAERGESGDAEALTAIGQVARVELLARGVLAPTENELYQAIDRIGRRYCGLAKFRRAFLRATASIEPYTKRDEIETAHNEFVASSDRLYFYVGLAFGITIADLNSRR
jgi:hypothetical protein